MQLKTHGKAILVIGDTFSCKDCLKQLGGSWNKKLVGWMVAQGHGAHCISLAMVGTRCLAGESGVSKGGAEKVSRRQCDARASNPK